eukprot:CAMPEP_0174982370 /NCGR_PEP_ID=MMETSP0004_2-20121128/16463_1 /TAXON_ID=420556 /ORGANISM="Ochromonas sp., Strain CCMP1393" /LENGTH=607 /DNA_ID=CAMNT_0016234329 /DNA_START=172 /DNA_END=1998 /DNA_ORIENTATION=+
MNNLTLRGECDYYKQECAKLKKELSRVSATNLVQQKEQSDGNADSLLQMRLENQQLHRRLNAMNTEHREVKKSWLAEKNDLQARFHQILALHTQTQGSLKKKEKDFDKLQNQLARLVKDSNRACGMKPVLEITPTFFPPSQKHEKKSQLTASRKNEISSSGSRQLLLRDAELQAAQQAVTTLHAENQVLRSSLDALRNQMDEVSESFESALKLNEAKGRQQVEYLLEEHNTALQQKELVISALQQQLLEASQQQQQQQQQPLQQTTPTSSWKTAAAAGPGTAVEKKAQSTPQVVHTPPASVQPGPGPAVVGFLSPAASTAAAALTMAARNAHTPSSYTPRQPQPCLFVPSTSAIHTPTATTTSSIPAGISGSLVKRYLEGTPGARPVTWAVEEATSAVKQLRARAETIGSKSSSEGDTFCGTAESTPSMLPLLRMKIASMRDQLAEAFVVMQEQDKLIHAALVGKPEGFNATPASSPSHAAATTTASSEEEVEEEAVAANVSERAKQEVLNHLEQMNNLVDADFLPAASPATWTLLQSCGWEESMLPYQQQQLPVSGSTSALQVHAPVESDMNTVTSLAISTSTLATAAAAAGDHASLTSEFDAEIS